MPAADLPAPPLANPSPSAHRLLVLQCVDLAWTLGFPLLLQGAFLLSSQQIKLMFGGANLLWLAMAIAEVVFLRGLRREVGPHRAAGPLGAALGLATAALVLAALSLLASFDVFDVFHLLPGDLGRVVRMGLHLGVSVPLDIVLWVALERLVEGSGEPTGPGLRAAFYACRLASAALGALSLLPLDTYRALMTSGPLSSIRPWLFATLTLGWSVPVLVLLRRVAQRAPVSAAGIAVPVAPTGQNDAFVGALWLGGGLLATAVSYSAAASAGNGRYMITVGPIAYGVVRMVRGLSRAGTG
jgi:hypothetical protein